MLMYINALGSRPDPTPITLISVIGDEMVVELGLSISLSWPSQGAEPL